LSDFPYANSFAGQFHVSAHVKDGILDYAEGWPRIDGIDADLIFDRQKMDIVGRRGRILGTELSDVRVSLPDMLAPQAVLVVRGRAAGPTREFLAYVAKSPLRRMTGGFTDTLSASGDGKLRLSLDLPLEEPERTTVAGEYEFVDNDVGIYPDFPRIEHATGGVAFTESGFEVKSVKGVLLGGAMTITGGMRRDSDLRVVARGEASAGGLRPILGKPWSGFASGATSYVATLRARGGHAEVEIESRLRGMTIGLPEPLAKSAAKSMPLRIVLRPGARAGETRVGVRVEGIAAVEVVRTREGRESVSRASVALGPQSGRPMRLREEPGLLVYGSLPKLNLDRWLEVLPRGKADGQRADFDLGFGVLDAYGKRLHDVLLKGTADREGWSTNIGSAEMAGELAYHEDGRGKLVGRLARLRVPEDTPGAAPVRRSRDDLPAIDLVAERFALQDKELGRIELLARPSGLDWQIDNVAMRNPDATISAKGLWRTLIPDPGGGASPGPRTSLNVTIDAKDAGKFLERIGYPGLVKGGNVRLSGAIAWDGDPVSIHYPSLSGELSLQAKDGQFLKADPGVGKLVSLMNLQMLPKRLTLDFSDVIEKGFQFERISSSLHLKRGVLSTQDFTMRGSAAEVEIRGETSLVAETQNLHVRVVPSLGAGAATIAAILSGPAAAVGSLLAEKVLKDPLGQIFASEYSVTGTWTNPNVERISAAPVSEESTTR
jgi:uncharacterized protein (TIGR02099 family)